MFDRLAFEYKGIDIASMNTGAAMRKGKGSHKIRKWVSKLIRMKDSYKLDCY